MLTKVRNAVLAGTFLVSSGLVFAQIPLATFNGTVHGVSKKQITIESAEGNLVDFEINRKTRVTLNKKQISPEDLHTGDPVTIEAKQEMVRFLVAVTITAHEKPKD
jgi:hypothetical protein